ncbi:MAG: T9SS type A sorting domain-containing protein [Candidatus Kapaibacteriota bacterium]
MYVEPSTKHSGPTEIFITDLYGNNILNARLNIETNELIEIDVSNLPCGLYFLVLKKNIYTQNF